MERCKSCGTALVEGAKFCAECGAPACGGDNAQECKKSFNYWSIAALAIASILAVLCFVTALADSSSFLNRMYTTAVEWNLPLVCIVAIAAAFITTCKSRGNHLLNYIAVGLLVVAFCSSNINKNKVQDYISNCDNIVSVVAEGVGDNVSNLSDWMDEAEDAVKDAGRAWRAYEDSYARRYYRESDYYDDMY